MQKKIYLLFKSVCLCVCTTVNRNHICKPKAIFFTMAALWPKYNLWMEMETSEHMGKNRMQESTVASAVEAEVDRQVEQEEDKQAYERGAS